MKEEKEKQSIVSRPPVVVIMGHIDHGKSTLLDYIRKTNIVDGEIGGITQHLSAYEVIHKNEKGEPKKITFLDTPGHEAFSLMRERGARVADIAVLVVSAEDSVKTQTVEAINTILKAKIPYIVAINKIDKPGANIEKTKIDLAEKEIYLEGYGGTIPVAEISAKIGTGIDHLLELILLVAEMENFEGNTILNAEGIIIESNLDTKRGVSGTMIIKDGTLKKGMYVVVGGAIVGTRIIEDFLGKQISEASFSSPIRIVGFDTLPKVGEDWKSYNTKKEAEIAVSKWNDNNQKSKNGDNINRDSTAKVVPIIIKTDVAGTGEAIEKEISKLCTDEITCKFISIGVGSIGENDLKLASGNKETIIIGFNVKIDPKARDLNESMGVRIETFDIIYKISEWLKDELEKRRPKKQIAESTGKVKVLKNFSSTKERQVIGGRVESGTISVGNSVKIIRRDFEIGRGTIVGLEQGKVKTREVSEVNECGILIESKFDIAPGDYLEPFNMIEK